MIKANEMSSLRILVADDHDLICCGLRRVRASHAGSPLGKHQIEIALPGYKEFVANINLLSDESIQSRPTCFWGIIEAGPSIKKN
jgi:hypothetical protein